LARVHANGIEIEYETRGPREGRPLLLIMGLGTQMIMWPDGFVERLVERGHRVVRFDNRDSGLSTCYPGAPLDLNAVLTAAFGGGPPASVPYRLEDMADDTAALIHELGWGSAHVVGASMGGMIAQLVAIRHPGRVRSLTSIMSAPEFVAPEPEMAGMLATPMPDGRDAAIAGGVRIWSMLRGPGFPPDHAEEVETRDVIARAYDRHHDPEAVFRQLAAILASPGRRAALGGVHVPTLVIHGTADRLIPLVGGEMTAAAVPGAQLVAIEGMGHELPRGAWPRMVEAISALTERADTSTAERAS
jgi:pimeloyl-ACP methyl ester carboxylesterase